LHALQREEDYASIPEFSMAAAVDEETTLVEGTQR
jgi:hypothetical protein